jgi:molybdopterin synthase sulfur carrier subunit
MVLKKHSGFMPKIKVRFFANFREFTKTSELEIEGDTVRDIFEIICEKFQGLGNILFKDGKLTPYVNVFLNGESVLESGGLDISLKTNDEIAIFPPVSGG